MIASPWSYQIGSYGTLLLLNIAPLKQSFCVDAGKTSPLGCTNLVVWIFNAMTKPQQRYYILHQLGPKTRMKLQMQGTVIRLLFVVFKFAIPVPGTDQWHFIFAWDPFLWFYV